jgi:hypothetical protein
MAQQTRSPRLRPYTVNSPKPRKARPDCPSFCACSDIDVYPCVSLYVPPSHQHDSMRQEYVQSCRPCIIHSRVLETPSGMLSGFRSKVGYSGLVETHPLRYILTKFISDGLYSGAFSRTMSWVHYCDSESTQGYDTYVVLGQTASAPKRQVKKHEDTSLNTGIQIRARAD